MSSYLSALGDHLTKGPSAREYLARLSIVQPDDPMLRFGKKLGYRVTMYTPKPAPWHTFMEHCQALYIFQLGLVTFAYFAARTQPGPLRAISATIIALAVILYPFFYGKTNLGLADFGLPASGFLASLHTIDIFFLRDVEEVRSWSYGRFFCQLLAFPKEVQDSNSPRWQNFKSMGLCMLKLLSINIMLYSVPPPELMAQVKSPLAFIGYNITVGGVILQTLGCLIEGTFLVQGIIWGIEMHPMFNSPLAATNLRSFWGNWNLAVKDALHRTSFAVSKLGSKAKQVKKEKKPSKKFHHKDQLSETEAETEAEADGPHKGEANGTTSARDQRVAQRRKAAETKSEAPKAPEGGKKKKGSSGSFLKKAAAATFTFLVSGLFHEYMNHLAFGGATGENTSFFLAHAAGTIFYVWVGRNFPGVLERTPTWLAIILVNLYLFATTPLFCMPFLRAGMFEDLKGAGIFGPIRGFIWFWGQ